MRLLTELLEGLRFAGEAIWANKLRAALTTLGIIVGIVTVTLMGMSIEGLNRAFIGSLSALGADVLYIQRNAWFSDEEWWKQRNRRDITVQQARAFARQFTGAEAIAPQSETFRPVKYRGRSASGVWIVGNMGGKAERLCLGP